MTVELKQWKTNISHGDKTQLKSIIPSLSLPFCLLDYLSWSDPTLTFQFLHWQSLHLSVFLTLNASNSTADSNRSVLFTVKSRWIFLVSKGQARMHTHKLIWRNCIAWLQKELCLSADTKGIRLNLNGYGVFQGTSGSRGEQPLMISSWFCPRRAFWQTLLVTLEYLDVMPEYHLWILKQCQPIQLLSLWFSGVWFISFIVTAKFWKNNLDLC